MRVRWDGELRVLCVGVLVQWLRVCAGWRRRDLKMEDGVWGQEWWVGKGKDTEVGIAG